MSTFKIGDSWISFHKGETGIGGGKLAAQNEAHTRAQPAKNQFRRHSGSRIAQHAVEGAADDSKK